MAPYRAAAIACVALVAPVSRDTARLSQRYPLLRAMGFLVSQHGQLGATPPPPFLSISALESMRGGGAIPPPEKGISAILVRYPRKTRQTGAIPPSAILSRKGIARYGGVSRTGPLSVLHASSPGLFFFSTELSISIIWHRLVPARNHRNFEKNAPTFRQDTKEYLNQRGYQNRSFLGVKKGGIKGEGKRGDVVGE